MKFGQPGPLLYLFNTSIYPSALDKIYLRLLTCPVLLFTSTPAMYLLRRAAVRAVSQQTTRQLSALSSSRIPRVVLLQTCKPTLSRPFHQSQIRGAEGNKEEAAVVAEVAQDAAIESAETAEDAAAAAEEAAEHAATATTEPEIKEAQEVAEGESSIAAEAASTAAAAAATSAAATASSSPPPEPSQQFPPRSAGSTVEPGTPSRILYIGNIFFEVTAPQLEAEFSQIGTVTNSRIVTDVRGQSKGFGYIEFSDQAAADRAVQELDQKTFQGRRMAVQYHVPRAKPRSFSNVNNAPRESAAPSKTLFIGNMSYQMSDKDLNDLFREIRDVLDVRVAIDRRSGQPRGFAHADFIDIQSAQRAKAVLENKVIYGRQLRVDFSHGVPNSQAARQ